MKKILLFCLLGFLLGCSTHQVKTASATRISAFGKEIRLVVTGENPNIASQLSRYIQARLLTAGFNISQDSQATALTVNISEFTPGNAALRIAISFGAGRGSLIYNAKYSKGDQLLLDYDGAERFTGLEIAPGTEHRPFGNFGGEETATKILMEEAAKHIVEQAE